MILFLSMHSHLLLGARHPSLLSFGGGVGVGVGVGNASVPGFLGTSQILSPSKLPGWV